MPRLRIAATVSMKQLAANKERFWLANQASKSACRKACLSLLLAACKQQHTGVVACCRGANSVASDCCHRLLQLRVSQDKAASHRGCCCLNEAVSCKHAILTSKQASKSAYRKACLSSLLATCTRQYTTVSWRLLSCDIPSGNLGVRMGAAELPTGLDHWQPAEKLCLVLRTMSFAVTQNRTATGQRTLTATQRC